MNSFLIVFDATKLSREALQQFVDTRPEILNWYAMLPNLLLITSHANAATLSQTIRTAYPGIFFVLAEVHRTTTDGWMPQLFWTHLITPTHVPTE